MTTADKTIGWVENNYLGRAEPFPPKGGEWIPFQEAWGYPPSTMVEWCGGLWCEAVRQTGGTVSPTGTIPNTWYTPSGVQAFMARGDWVPADGSQQPQRGWLVYFDWGGGGWVSSPGDAGRVDHVEMVTDGSMWSQATGWAFETIGGNVDERCARFRRYDTAQVVGFGRPRYTAVVPPRPEPEGIQVKGAIGERWRAIGGNASPVGAPVENERPFLTHARVQKFQHGSIVWSDQTGAWEVYGEIGRRWWADAAGIVGMPTSGEWDGEHAGWRWQQFQNGRILYTPTGGARILKGAILLHYLSEAPDVRARLGAPLSDEVDARASVFAGGQIGWTKQAGAFTSR